MEPVPEGAIHWMKSLENKIKNKIKEVKYFSVDKILKNYIIRKVRNIIIAINS